MIIGPDCILVRTAFPGLPDLGRVWQDLDHLPAWWVFEQRGKAKLDVRFSDGSRQTTVLPFRWLPADAVAIQKAVEQIAALASSGRSLADATAQIRGFAAPALPSLMSEQDDLWAGQLRLPPAERTIPQARQGSTRFPVLLPMPRNCWLQWGSPGQQGLRLLGTRIPRNSFNSCRCG